MGTNRQFARVVVFLLCITFSSLLFAGQGAQAGSAAFAPQAGIVVTSLEDDLLDNGNCTLREAVAAANTDAARDACPAGSGIDTIVLPAGKIQMTFGASSDNLDPGLTEGDLDVTEGLVVAGQGREVSVVDGGHKDRIFEVSDPAVSLTLRDLTLQNGDVTTREDTLYVGGGAVQSFGPLTIERTAFLNNMANEPFMISSGGAVYSKGELVVLDSLFEGNQAYYYDGGGLFSDGPFRIERSVFRDNRAYEGGGLFLGGTGVIYDSLFENNWAPWGGGIKIILHGDLSADQLVVRNNEGQGGGIYVVGVGALHLSSSLIQGNSGFGSAIFAGGYDDIRPLETVVSVSDTTLIGNQWFAIAASNAHVILNDVTIQGGGEPETGGIHIEGLGSVLEVHQSTFIDLQQGAWMSDTDTEFDQVTMQNCASGAYGGGGAVYQDRGTLKIFRSTIRDGSAGTRTGAALHVWDGSALVVNSTIAGNSGTAGVVYVTGGELDLDSVTLARNDGGGLTVDGGTARVHNSIIAENRIDGQVVSGSDCQAEPGGIVSLGYNLVGHLTGCNWVKASGDKNGLLSAPLDPELGSLEDNGGPTWTMELQWDSPALDYGDNAHCPALDQRGFPRPKDGNGNGNASCDIGAYEVQGSLATKTPTPAVTRTTTQTLTPTVTSTGTVAPDDPPTATSTPTRTATVPAQPATATTVVEPTQAAELPPVIYLPFIGG